MNAGDTHRFIAREVVGWRRDADEATRRQLELIVLALLEHSTRGSTRLGFGNASERRRLREILIEVGGSDTEAKQALATLVQEPTRLFGPLSGGPDENRPFVVDHECICLHRWYELERCVAAHLRDRFRKPMCDASAWLARALRDVENSPPLVDGRRVRLTREQRDAIERCVSSPLTLVTGGPGTGKTSIVLSILRVLVRGSGIPLSDMTLCAPTGRAADRMRRSVEIALRHLTEPTFADLDLLHHLPRSTTLHRLLGYSPHRKRFRHHSRNPLSQRFIIVDESSMLDLVLMERLLSALRPEAQLVFLGDADQLPSVDAGAVFRDLCRVRDVVRLQKSFRMDPKDPAGRSILRVARRINRGETSKLFDGEAEDCIRSVDVPNVSFHGVEHVDPLSIAVRKQFFDRWWEVLFTESYCELTSRQYESLHGSFLDSEKCQLDELFLAVARWRILAAVHGGALGVHAINRWFHTKLARRLGDHASWLPGEPVIVQRNDYDNSLYNGDQGIVLHARLEQGAPQAMAVFRKGNGYRAFPIEAVRSNLELAYAITIHKAQGSEYEHVAVSLPDADSPLLSREIVYTAMTRAKKSVVVLASRARLESAIQRSDGRSTGLAELLELHE